MSDEWLVREVTVVRELGLHARPAGQIVAAAAKFTAEVEVGRDGEWVSGRSVLSILSLAATRGTVLVLRAQGDDAEAALAAIAELIEAETD